jgi:hypothetical protein
MAKNKKQLTFPLVPKAKSSAEEPAIVRAVFLFLGAFAVLFVVILILAWLYTYLSFLIPVAVLLGILATSLVVLCVKHIRSD